MTCRRVTVLAALLVTLVKGGEYLWYFVSGSDYLPVEFSAQTYIAFALIVLLDKDKKLYPFAGFAGILAGMVYNTGALLYPDRFVLESTSLYQVAAGIVAHDLVMLGGVCILKSTTFQKGSFVMMSLGGALFLTTAFSAHHLVGVSEKIYLVTMLDGTLLDGILPRYVTESMAYAPLYYLSITAIYMLIIGGVVLLNRIIRRYGLRRERSLPLS